MNQKTIVIIVVFVVAALGVFFVARLQKKPVDGMVPVAVVTEVAQVSTSTEVAPATPATQPLAATTKIYTNAAFGYSFSYPSSWVLEPETSVKDLENDMPSIVSVHDMRPFSPQRFSVTINRKERTIKNQAPKKESITVGGEATTAYIFPDGLDCKPTKTDPDCSFFIIPIQRGGVWYEINVANEAGTLDAYRTVLSSFKFTK